ncbi:hypothetical protein DFJ74DRAFT_765037 [Hyaloraphidium curvatum]|nr:hypothetical protein DFJ74DRAFT_765037 [Hyaloraphidium curvatum]
MGARGSPPLTAADLRTPHGGDGWGADAASAALDRSLVVVPEGPGDPKARLVIEQLRHEINVRDADIASLKGKLARRDFDTALRRNGTPNRRGTPGGTPGRGTPAKPGTPFAPFALAARGARSAGRQRLADLGTPGTPGTPARPGTPGLGRQLEELDLSDDDDYFDDAEEGFFYDGDYGEAEGKWAAELEAAKREAEALRDELQRSKEDLQGAKEDLRHAQDALTRSQDELEGTRDELERTRGELEQTRDDLERTRDDFDRVREDLDRTREDLEQTRHELDRARDELEHAGHHPPEPDSALYELSQARSDLARAHDDLARAHEELRRTVHELDLAQDHLDAEKNARAKEVGDLLAALSAQESRLRAAEAQPAGPAVADHLRRTVEEQRGTIDALRREKAGLVAQLRAPRGPEDGAGLAQARAALQEDWKRLSGNLFSLAGKLRAAVVEAADPSPPPELEQPPPSFSPTYLHRACKILLALMHGLPSGREGGEAEERARRVAEELRSLEGEAVSLQREIVALRDVRGRMEADLGRLKEERRALKALCGQMSDHLKRAAEKLEELQGRVAAQEGRLERLARREEEAYGKDADRYERADRDRALRPSDKENRRAGHISFDR